MHKRVITWKINGRLINYSSELRYVIARDENYVKFFKFLSSTFTLFTPYRLFYCSVRVKTTTRVSKQKVCAFQSILQRGDEFSLLCGASQTHSCIALIHSSNKIIKDIHTHLPRPFSHCSCSENELRRDLKSNLSHPLVVFE